MYGTLSHAFVPMSETVTADGGGVGHEKRSAYDGVSERWRRMGLRVNKDERIGWKWGGLR